MDFDLSDDRRMLDDTLRRWLSDRYPVAHRTAVAYDPPFHDAESWTGLADLGVLGALVGADCGGYGGTGFDIAAVFNALGRALCPEPVLPALLAARILAAAGEDLFALVSGRTRYALAIGEPDAPFASFATRAVQDGQGWRLTGRKSVVYGGGVADRLLVAALAGGGPAVFEVGPGDAEIISYGMIDGGNAAELFLDRTPARLLLPDAQTVLEDAVEHGSLALCAESVGAMETAADMLLDYLKTRRQFGRPIGSFQALQHRMVDLATEIEQARSITILAASRMGTQQQSRTVSMARNLTDRTAKRVAEELIQMHGGIAMTWEHPASHYAKRLVMIGHQLGDADYHLKRVMEGARGDD